jgi:hypothetical protein
VDNGRFRSKNLQSELNHGWKKQAHLRPIVFTVMSDVGLNGYRFEWADLHGFESFKTCKYKKNLIVEKIQNHHHKLQL